MLHEEGVQWLRSGGATARDEQQLPVLQDTLIQNDNAGTLTSIRERAGKGDADAMVLLGDFHYRGRHGLTEDVTRAKELWTEAAELGSLDAHYNLGRLIYGSDKRETDKHRILYH